jgi:hypothetical protein
MGDKPISPLRQRMIEDMTVRNFVEKTRNDYIRHVRTFTAFLGRAPDTATPEDLRLFQLHQTQIGVRAPSINGSVAALRFFFNVTLDRPEIVERGILDVLADDARAPLVAAAKEIGAGMMVSVGVLITVAVVHRHDDPLSECPCAKDRLARQVNTRAAAPMDATRARLLSGNAPSSVARSRSHRGPRPKLTSLWRAETDSVPLYSPAVDVEAFGGARNWPIADKDRCLLFGRFWGQSRMRSL